MAARMQAGRRHPAPECSNIAERSFRDLSPLRRSRFHTVLIELCTNLHWELRLFVTKAQQPPYLLRPGDSPQLACG